jgi:hypothetical protein
VVQVTVDGIADRSVAELVALWAVLRPGTGEGDGTARCPWSYVRAGRQT